MAGFLNSRMPEFEYYAAKLECAVRIAEMLKKEQPRLSELEHEVYWLLGARKTKDEKAVFLISDKFDFMADYQENLEKSKQLLENTKCLERGPWIIFFNEYGSPKKQFISAGDEKIQVQFKQYFTIDASSSPKQCMRNAEKLAEIVPYLAGVAENLSKKTNDRISFKIPFVPTKLFSYLDNVVFYHQRPETGRAVQKDIGAILDKYRINERRAPGTISGFDFQAEFNGSILNGSYMTLISRVIASELIESGHGSPEELTETIMMRKTQLSKLSPEEMVRALEGL